MNFNWNPKDFQNVVRIVMGPECVLRRYMVSVIRQSGSLSCPAPKWDSNGCYRVSLVKDELKIQKLTSDEKWENANITPPTNFNRKKQQKFRILDSQKLLSSDMKNAGGLFGFSLIYLDIDDFKLCNTKFTERVVDKTILPQFQRLIESSVSGNGYAYAEGGDEVIILLPNISIRTAIAFAEELRELIENKEFYINEQIIKLTISIGIAASEDIKKYCRYS
ncbi:MAG: hypothetical protein SCARUB_00519 [Candidatus Scalindua rubra]|uniref:GGDEF domain-containing protein n=1 Tax=Candidatus Scalindua rubra TaxID=1872076 RepID=A0A1E3XFL4_9BACT|nr:MAG: hypothetical protein SCARUB_00519 [Candidatus Scalindua rubra]